MFIELKFKLYNFSFVEIKNKKTQVCKCWQTRKILFNIYVIPVLFLLVYMFMSILFLWLMKSLFMICFFVQNTHSSTLNLRMTFLNDLKIFSMNLFRNISYFYKIRLFNKNNFLSKYYTFIKIMKLEIILKINYE